MYELLVLVLAVLAPSIVVASGPPNYNVDVQRYCYICLSTNQDLCLGISPGDGLPFYNPNLPPYYLQIKQRERNQLAGLDYKKTRWDVRFDENIVYLSRFPNLCIALPSTNTYPNQLALYPCDYVRNGTILGYWLSGFNTNINEEGNMQLLNQEVCVTVMDCGGAPFCNLQNENVVTNGRFKSGSYVKVKPCWWTSQGSPAWRDAQTFVQALDCAVGCPPMLQFNNVCDPPCDNTACHLDNGHCKSLAPTPPSFTPTNSPTFKPTKSPVVSSPSKSPITYKPSSGPTAHPTATPTTLHPTDQPISKSPTSFPSYNPTVKLRSPTPEPTSKFPTLQPTNLPISLQPSSSPTTHAPTTSPVTISTLNGQPSSSSPTVSPPEQMNIVIVIAILVPTLLLLLLCLVLILVYRERKRKFKKNQKWDSMIDVNQAAFVEHQRNYQARRNCCNRCFSGNSSEVYALSPFTATSPPPATVDHIVISNPNWTPSTTQGKKKRPKLTGV